MRFLIDAQLPRHFVIWLAGEGHDALHTLNGNTHYSTKIPNTFR